MGFSTYILDDVLRRKRAADEAERLRLLEKARSALREASKRFTFKKAYIFGSLAKPYAFKKGSSDVDVAFVGLPLRDFFKMMSFLSERLHVDVDVVQMEEARSLLRSRIEKEGVPWTPDG